MRLLVVACLAGCWGTTGDRGDTVVTTTADKPGLFTVRSTGFGPIDATTVATLENLRKLFRGYEVRPVNDPNLEYHIFAGSERVAFIVLNDDMTVFNVHATSGKISVSDRRWRVGQPFHNHRDLTKCECWGDNPTCYRSGEHIGLNFKRPCGDVTSGEPTALRQLEGQIVQRIIWSPTPFGPDTSFGGDSYGGDGGDP